jgi:mono/diheme cytochrome c family protein
MRLLPVGAILFVVATLGACSPSAPDVPTGADGRPDPILVQGRDVYQANCVQCHGSSGGGGRAPQLNGGAAAASYPDIATQIEVVTNGKGGMPAFGGRLEPAEIEAVVRYTRDVLADIE